MSSNLHNDSPSFATAELTWALVLAAMRQIPQQVAALKRGEWQVDIGRIVAIEDPRDLRLRTHRRGRRRIRHARSGCTVQVWGGEGTRTRALEDGVDVAAEPARRSSQTSDVVSLHLRLVDATRGIVTAADLAR